MEKGESNENSRFARSQTDPLWLQDHFLKTGHNLTTRNGTATFVSFLGRQFAVTCRHVMDAVSNPDVVPGAPHPTAALQIDRVILNLSFFRPAGMCSVLSAPSPNYGEQEVDVAIAELSGSYWKLLANRKGKKAIDLDNWREPNWRKVTMCAAAGYPDEHKELAIVAGKETILSPMCLAVGEVASPLARDQRIITLSSRLEVSHGSYFSGMSGGALYTIENGGLVPVGIVFEGYPSTKKQQASRATSPTFLQGNDIFIRALTLTPEIFEEWLQRTKFAR